MPAAWRHSIALSLALVACKQERSKLDGVLVPERPPDRIALDGEWNERPWNELARRGVFSAEGGQARPYSEIRLLRDETHLLVALYAADEDIRSDDAFELTAGTLAARLAAGGRATPGTIRAAVDHDGTLDDARDDDEEWVVEAEIPLAALGSSPVAFTASRCDTTKDGVRRCGSWTGALDLATLPAVK